MAHPVISVEGLGRRFVVGRRGRGSARGAIERLLRAPARVFTGTRDVATAEAHVFWALRDVTFRVDAGEVVGILGRNGAGKSVLLKLLARVIRPTTGRAEIRGRVAPLLEIGTGFHPDLTGRENIYLNGAILGMRRDEVHRRVDEIVAFAEADEFLDAPVRQYSSGMRVRLAFAVAAHLERDVFLLDEVLAVGDASFQEKCLAKLRTLAAHGRTILLVSHGNDVAENFCSRALLFDHGGLVTSGAPADVVQRYQRLRREAAGRGDHR